MPPTVAGKELKKIEEQFLLELEQGKRKAANEDSKESAVTTATEKSPSTPEGCVFFCFFPKLIPTLKRGSPIRIRLPAAEIYSATRCNY